MMIAEKEVKVENSNATTILTNRHDPIQSYSLM